MFLPIFPQRFYIISTKNQVLPFQPHPDFSGLAAPAQKVQGQGAFHPILHQPPHLPGTAFSLTVPPQRSCQLLGKPHADPLASHPVFQFPEVFPGDGLHRCRPQGLEVDDPIQPPQKLRGKGLPQGTIHLPRSACGRKAQTVSLHLTADIGGHHHNGIFKADPAAFGICQAPFFHDLQKDPRHIGMGLFQFVHQDQAVRTAADGFCELVGMGSPDLCIATQVYRAILEREAEDVRSILIFEDITTGERMEFPAEDTSCWADTNLEYIDARTESIVNKVGKFADFRVYSRDGEDVTLDMLNKSGRVAWLCINDSEELTGLRLQYAERLLDAYPPQAVVVLTTSSTAYISKLLKSEVYTIDAMTLRSMMRADVGVVVINDGVIEFKADIRDI